MKMLIILAIIFNPFNNYSQEGIKLPEITPPSPEAYELTKYGDIQVNEFAGMATSTIPIFNLKAGLLELPVSLNYSGSGVKVNQLSTWTGINWVLDAGGVISRTINHLPDEGLNTAGRLTGEDINAMNLADQTDDVYQLNNMFDPAFHLDRKPDMFSFKFPGYSGSFYLDSDFVPHISKLDSPLKIVVVGTSPDAKTRLRDEKTFCITTPEGVRYYFGGANGCENSYQWYASNLGGVHSVNPLVPTAYYLYQIIHPFNGVINLEYLNSELGTALTVDRQQSINLITDEEATTGFSCDGPGPNTSLENYSTLNKIFNGKFLSRITSVNNDMSIEFNSSNGSLPNYRRVLNSIVKKNGDEVIEKANLTYYSAGLITSAERFFLTKVQLNKEISDDITNGASKKYEEFNMDYKFPEQLPVRFSYAQDHAGYYNGKLSNSMYLPQNDDIDFHNYFTGLADRNADFAYTEIGTLIKIHYPTGGYTEFEYEPIPAKDYNVVGKFLKIWRNRPAYIPDNQTSALYTGGVGTVVISEEPQEGARIGSIKNQELVVTIHINSDQWMGHTDKVKFVLTDITFPLIVPVVTEISMPQSGTIEMGTGLYSYTQTFTLTLQGGHDYHMRLYNDYESPVSFEATASFSFIMGYKLVADGGIRVKRVKDYSSGSQPSLVKRYYYCAAEDITKDIFETLPFRRKLNYVKEQLMYRCCENPNIGLISISPFSVNYKNLCSSMSAAEVFDKTYDVVTTSYGGDNFEIGGYEREYDNRATNNNMNIHIAELSPFQAERLSARGNIGDIYSGTLQRETEIITNDNQLFKKNEKRYTYNYNQLHSTTAVTGGIAYEACSLGDWDHFDLGMYSLFSKQVKLSEIITKEFIDPMPIASHNVSLYRAIISTQTFEYGILPGLPTKSTTSTSDPNVTIETYNTYAPDASLINDLNIAQKNACAQLADQNRVSNPIQVEVKQNTSGIIVPLSKKLTLYKQWDSNSLHIYPQYISASKGNEALEEKIIFYEYDFHGNINLAGLKDGIKTKYYYNSLDQPVLKIENYTAPAGTLPGGPGIFAPPDTAPCAWHTTYPGSMVTAYYYDPITNVLARTIDQNCRSTFYVFDALKHLVSIKDHYQNLIKQFDYNYRN